MPPATPPATAAVPDFEFSLALGDAVEPAGIAAVGIAGTEVVVAAPCAVGTAESAPLYSPGVTVGVTDNPEEDIGNEFWGMVVER